jgi:hypothetical protein
MTDWTATAESAIDAASSVLGGAWANAATAGKAQIVAMAQVAAQTELDYASDPPRLTQDEYESLKAAQITALKGILSAYEGIGILAAQQAADAAWGVIQTALKASIPFA